MKGLPESLVSALALTACLLSVGCIRLKSDPIEVNVNVRLKVDRELRDVFRELDAVDPTMDGAPGTVDNVETSRENEL